LAEPARGCSRHSRLPAPGLDAHAALVGSCQQDRLVLFKKIDAAPLVLFLVDHIFAFLNLLSFISIFLFHPGRLSFWIAQRRASYGFSEPPEAPI
jgi:hypothetical protein